MIWILEFDVMRTIPEPLPLCGRPQSEIISNHTHTSKGNLSHIARNLLVEWNLRGEGCVSVGRVMITPSIYKNIKIENTFSPHIP